MKNSTIIQASPEELAALIVKEVNQSIKLINSSPPTVEEEFLDIDGASAFLKISPSTLRKKAQKNAIPCFKRNNKWLFSKLELTTYIQEGKQISINEL
jgi:hypothetical protein